MNLLSNYIGSFCEIKTDEMSETCCTGYIVSADGNQIVLSRMSMFSNILSKIPFRGVITTLDSIRGLQVFRARITDIDSQNHIYFEDVVKITDEDRRSAFRVDVDLFANIIKSPAGEKPMSGIIKDMSVSGVSIWLSDMLNVDDIITLTFSLTPDTVIHTCECNIVREIENNNSRLKKYGCQFTNVSAASSAAINQFLNQKRAETIWQGKTI